MIRVQKRINLVVIAWLLIEFFHQLLRQVWVLWGSWILLRACWVRGDRFPVRRRLGERFAVGSNWAFLFWWTSLSRHVMVGCLSFCAPSFCGHWLSGLTSWRGLLGVICESTGHFDWLPAWGNPWRIRLCWGSLNWRSSIRWHEIILSWCGFLVCWLFVKIKVSCLLFAHHVVWRSIWWLILLSRNCILLSWRNIWNPVVLIALQLNKLLALKVELLPLHLDLTLLILDLPQGILLGLHYQVVIGNDLLIKLIQLLELIVIISPHILHHCLVSGCQCAHSLLVGRLELCVHPFDAVYVYLFNLNVSDVGHILSIF